MPEINGNGVLPLNEKDATVDTDGDSESRKRRPVGASEETPTKKQRTDGTREDSPTGSSNVGENSVLVVSEAAASPNVDVLANQPGGESDSDVVELSDGENEDEDEEEEVGSDDEEYPDQRFQGRPRRQEVYDLSDDDEESEGSSNVRARPLVIPDWPHAHHCVLVLRLRRPFYIVGNYEAKCVKGCVDIMGTTLSPSEGFTDFVPVYSSRVYGAVPIEIKSSEPEPEDEEVLKRLENKHFSCRSQDVVLVLRRLQNSVIQHIQNYGPNSLGLSKQLVAAGNTTFPNLNFINCVGLYEKQAPFFKDCGLRFLDLDMEFLYAAIFDPMGPKEFAGTVLACGGKNTGKSTLLRCLINATLSAKGPSPVLFLDCDPGQCEFSVSGSVSLVEVTSPLIGPAFTHNTKPVLSYFLGHTNIVSCPHEYLLAITKLVEVKHATPKYKHSPVFVNTMGWARGMGVDLLVEVIRLLKPQFVIQLQSKSDSHNLPTMSCEFVSKYSTTLEYAPTPKEAEEIPLTASGDLPYDFQLLQYRSAAEGDSSQRSVDGMRAPINRDLMTLAYFSQLQPGIAQPAPLNSIVPYKVPWKSVAIQSNHSCIPVKDLLSLVVGNLVALCHAEDTDLVSPKDPSHPKLLRHKALPTCVGYGFVRAIDPKKKMLYVVTPMMPKALREVNCLSVGVVAMPQSILDESPHYFSVSPGEILAPNRGDSFRPALQRGVVPRTFKKRSSVAF